MGDHFDDEESDTNDCSMYKSCVCHNRHPLRPHTIVLLAGRLIQFALRDSGSSGGGNDDVNDKWNRDLSSSNRLFY